MKREGSGGRGALATSVCLMLVVWQADGRGQAGDTRRLTLADAKALAVANHPRISAAESLANAAISTIAETRSPYFPALSANLTTVSAEPSAAIAAGALSTSSLADRLAGGVVASQLLTDFGRTNRLTAAARLNATAQERHVDETRANVVLEVANAYYESLGADAVLTAAQADLDTKRLLLRQVNALAESDLKSTLDVSFAEVAVSQGELQVERAHSSVQAARARLTAALGDTTSINYELVDEDLPPPLGTDPQLEVDEAIRNRPELLASRLRYESAGQFAEAESRLSFPSVSLLGVAGALPSHDERLRGSYSAAGVNISIPVLNGGLYAARRAEASDRLTSASREVGDQTLAITRDVKVAWLQATSALKVIDVTAKLVDQADKSLRLANTRYEVGLGSIVEVTQAQLSQTSARIEAAKAKYDYLERRAALEYAAGRLR